MIIPGENMEEKKRSTGVTVFGWLFIIGGAWSILTLIILGRTIKGTGNIYYFISSSLSFICGIYILKLRSWAKQLAIILCLVSVIFIIIVMPGVVNDAVKNFYKQEDIKRQVILEKIKPEYQKEALESLKQKRAEIDKSIPTVKRTMFLMGIGIPVARALIVIYFFTRPKVKEQFME